jgi:hypothetical protein
MIFPGVKDFQPIMVSHKNLSESGAEKQHLPCQAHPHQTGVAGTGSDRRSRSDPVY